MDGVHDMGGMHGFGPVEPEADEPVFHAEWERRVLALTLAAGVHGRWSIDQSRAYRESLPPVTYLSSSYYEIWLRALEQLVDESGLLDEEGGAPDAEAMIASLVRGTTYDREPTGPAAFAVGDRVRTRHDHPAGHTRLPRYARDRVGTVVAVRGTHVFADASGVRLDRERPDRAEWLYAVEFAATDLWGADADPTATLALEAWEPYLEAAS